jgi:hypothetical protein
MERVDYQPLIIQDLLNDADDEKLNLNPWYQRRSVWTIPQKAYLINTLFERKPVPSIYIRHALDLEKDKSIKEVVDGQQRIRSIISYVNDEFPARHPETTNKCLYRELTLSQKERFKLTPMSIGFLVGASDSDVIDMFGRLNSVSKTLNQQEKRNARFSGEFKQLCLKEAAKRVQLWRDLNVFSATEISRMTEVQFISELIINMMNGLSDYSVKQIDSTYERYDESFLEHKNIKKALEITFSKIASLPVATIRDTIFSRYPLFFSLFLIIDSIKGRISNSALETGLYEIDEIFNSDPSSKKRSDIDFYVACTSNPHRIKSRSVRDKYIRRRLGLDT